MAATDVPLAIDVVATHAKAAGLSLRNKLTDVRRGFATPKGSRSVRVYFGGETDPRRMGGNETLGHQMVGIRVLVSGFWFISNLSDDLGEVVDDEVWLFTYDLSRRLIADKTLGGHVTDMSVGEAEVGFISVGTADVLELTLELVLEFPELYAISA